MVTRSFGWRTRRDSRSQPSSRGLVFRNVLRSLDYSRQTGRAHAGPTIVWLNLTQARGSGAARCDATRTRTRGPAPERTFATLLHELAVPIENVQGARTLDTVIAKRGPPWLWTSTDWHYP